MPLVIALVVYAALVVTAFTRSRLFGVFAVIVLGIPTYVGTTLGEHLAGGPVVVVTLLVLACFHFGALVVYPARRSSWFRMLCSIPGLWFVACSLLALPWAVVASLGFEPWGAWIPFALGLGGLVQSVYTCEEEVEVELGVAEVSELRRYTEGYRPFDASRGRPLRIVQITDPHLGPFMSVARLRKICQRAVEREPDLIFITGDLMTMESQNVEMVSAALAPLAKMRGRVFACHGNHDHEARAVVEQAYIAHDIILLVDDARSVSTPAGEVQILGLDFVWRDRQPHIEKVCAAHPRVEGALRVMLLHDPGAFRHVPNGQGDLVLSGHTHGGQVGLVSLGLSATFLSVFTKIPDHGLWALGRNRMYIHRAQGHYGYPIRLGVPAEQSLMLVHPWAEQA